MPALLRLTSLIGCAALLAAVTGCAGPAHAPTSSSDDARCGACHASERDAWVDSRHATSFTSSAFQASWSRTRAPWCLTCHAPAGAEQGGVGCVTCHVTAGGAVRSAREPSAAALAVHRVVVEPSLRDEQCARCHEVPLPTPSQVDAWQPGATLTSTVLAQGTMREWRGWTARADPRRSCAACHGGPHAARASRDAHAWSAALRWDVQRGDTDDVILVTATATDDVGHAVPTGDPFRRLVVRVCADARCTEVLGAGVLGRAWEVDTDGVRAIADTRVAPGGARVLEVPLSRDAGACAVIDVEARLAEHVLETQLDERDRRVPIARLTIPARAPAAAALEVPCP